MHERIPEVAALYSELVATGARDPSIPRVNVAMAMANRISWGWCIAAIMGIAISFGAPQIVTWVRGMFSV